MLQFLPYLAAAYGGYKGYQGAKDSGASGIGRILGGISGAYTGYSLGNMVPGTVPYSQLGQNYSALKGLPGQQLAGSLPAPFSANTLAQTQSKNTSAGTLLDILKNKETGKFDPFKTSAAIAAGTFLGGAFDQQPTDVYMPGYNMNYLDMKEKRPQYTYIDPNTGQEKAYEKIYSPEESGKGDPRMGPYSVNVQRFNTGGLSSIQKFNEGGVNYLPSKVSHDENDANNYVRASGYVEDGEGVGDKDEDTMLAQLADGEFVTRADGVLGAGIIAGGNPNSMKDMREKGAQYFYEQQKRYKRVFDLLKDSRNGLGKEKTN